MTTDFNRRHFLQVGAAIAASAATPVFGQDSKPPLRIIVPLPAGGVADSSVRFFGEQWTTITKQTVVIDNRPGGLFQIAMQQMLTAPADGNTLIHLHTGMSAAQATMQRFDMTKQLLPLGMLGTTPGAIFVPASSPIQNMQELISWIKDNPGKLSYASTGTGSLEHLLTTVFLRRYSLTGTNVPFKGGPDGMTAVAQNEVQMAVSALPLIVPFKGKVRVIAVLTEQRAAMAPNVPTYKEAGIEMQGLEYWGALAAPAATPKAIVDSMHKLMVEVMQTPSVMNKFTTMGMAPVTSAPEAMAKIIAEDVKWMAPLGAELNLKAG